MAKYTDTVSEATKELSSSVHETNRAITDSVVEAQERNWKFAQSILDNEVELLKSHAESTRTIIEKIGEEPVKGQAIFQLVTDSAMAAQERNVRFIQSFVEDGSEVLKSHVESTRTLIQTLTEQSHKQREALPMLIRGTLGVYRGLFALPFRYEQAKEKVEPIATQRVETVQKMAREGMGTAEKATHNEKQAIQAATK